MGSKTKKVMSQRQVKIDRTDRRRKAKERTRTSTLHVLKEILAN